MKEKITALAIIGVAIGSICITSCLDKETIDLQQNSKTTTYLSTTTQVSKKHTSYTATEKSKTTSVLTKENKMTTKQTKNSTTTTKKSETTKFKSSNSTVVSETPKTETVKKSETQTEKTEKYTTVFDEEDVSLLAYDVPLCENFYGYMDYRAITNTNSDQYQFQQICWTDSQGLRRQGDDYVVALGSYYSINIGDRFLVSLDTGITYTVVLGDCKADCHTNPTNQYVVVGNKINIIEFVVDTNALDYTVAQSGNIGTYKNLAGNVVSITKIE